MLRVSRSPRTDAHPRLCRDLECPAYQVTQDQAGARSHCRFTGLLFLYVPVRHGRRVQRPAEAYTAALTFKSVYCTFYAACRQCSGSTHESRPTHLVGGESFTTPAQGQRRHCGNVRKYFNQQDMNSKQPRMSSGTWSASHDPPGSRVSVPGGTRTLPFPPKQSAKGKILT